MNGLPTTGSSEMRILTFDVEDWFHLLDYHPTRTAQEWSRYESRIHQGMDRILEVLADTGTRATFFCLGWIAEKYPEIIRQIDSLGFEIGSHTFMHQLVYEQSRAEFSEDLRRSVGVLSEITGKPVRYFRAPGFSIQRGSEWAFEVLAEQGFEIDCSVFPAQRSHGGIPSFDRPEPTIVRWRGIDIKELPINCRKMFPFRMVYSGGGYFRLTPYWFIRRWTRHARYVMSYLHPRDFDVGQPPMPGLSMDRRFKCYVGIKTAERKLRDWLRDFQFTDVSTGIRSIDWRRVPVVFLDDDSDGD
jgi:polysaccharide deacetylase family protein (PEP-CTERM system associated)